MSRPADRRFRLGGKCRAALPTTQSGRRSQVVRACATLVFFLQKKHWVSPKTRNTPGVGDNFSRSETLSNANASLPQGKHPLDRNIPSLYRRTTRQH